MSDWTIPSQLGPCCGLLTVQMLLLNSVKCGLPNHVYVYFVTVGETMSSECGRTSNIQCLKGHWFFLLPKLWICIPWGGASSAPPRPHPKQKGTRGPFPLRDAGLYHRLCPAPVIAVSSPDAHALNETTEWMGPPAEPLLIFLSVIFLRRNCCSHLNQLRSGVGVTASPIGAQNPWEDQYPGIFTYL